MDENRIEGEGVKYLAEGLTNCLTLHTISLYWNSIGDEGAIGIESILSVEDKGSLKVLNLDRNNITSSGLVNIMNGLKIGGKDLEILNLSRNSIDDNGAVCISEILDNCGMNLMELNLEGNIISSDGCKVIHDGLNKCKYLYYLNLSSNSLENTGIKQLKDSLSAGSLTYFNINSIYILNYNFE